MAPAARRAAYDMLPPPVPPENSAPPAQSDRHVRKVCGGPFSTPALCVCCAAARGGASSTRVHPFMASDLAAKWRSLHGDSFRGSRALVTGGAGFIGSPLFRGAGLLRGGGGGPRGPRGGGRPKHTRL